MGKFVLLLIFIFIFLYVGWLALFDSGSVTYQYISRDPVAITIEKILRQAINIGFEWGNKIYSYINPAVVVLQKILPGTSF